MKDSRIGNSYFALRRYLFFFIVTVFIVTVCFNVFVKTLEGTIGREFSREELRKAAVLTFINVFVVSAILTLFDYVSAIYRIKKPVRKIITFTDELAGGNFGLLVRENDGIFANEFDVIISNLNSLSRELSGMKVMRTDFISNVSHEIKTPISIIQNYIQLILLDDSLSDEKRNEYLQSALQSSKRLSGLVTDILRLTRLENQEIFRKDSCFSLTDELADCILSFESRIDEKNLSLAVDIEDGIFIKSDRELLDIVWNNLISNAVKFTDFGGKIRISLESESGKSVVTVADSGCGISESEISKVFDKFYQADSVHKKEGNGLGLALVKRIVDILGGTVSVSSSAGSGSEFKVTLS